MNIGFQIDAVESLNIQTDSSLPLALESQKRQNKNFCYLPSTLTYKNNTVYAEGREIYFNNNKLENFKLTKKVSIKLDTLDYIFVRQDPPYNMEYISSLHILEQLADKVKIINNPKGIRNAPEKISMLAFKKIIPPTMITKSSSEVAKFIKRFGKAIIKPLYGNGGESIFLLDANDKNYNQIIENFINCRTEPFIIQKFLPEVRKGDKRIILLDGEPIAAIKRIPPVNDIRANIHVGGKSRAVKISKQDIIICNEIRGFLKKEGLFFVGIDIIGNFLTEINVTSPTCIQEIKKLHKLDISKLIWDRLTKKNNSLNFK